MTPDKLPLILKRTLNQDEVLEQLNLYLSRALPGCVAMSLLRRTEKSLLAEADFAGQDCIIKAFPGSDPFWREKFKRELDICVEFQKTRPAFFLPACLFLDAENLVIISEQIHGQALSPYRYLERPLSDIERSRILQQIQALSEYVPSVYMSREAILDSYRERLKRYASSGFLEAKVLAFYEEVLKRTQHSPVFAHGDPVFSNFLATQEKLYLIDWEFADYFLPDFDLAALSIFGMSDPELLFDIEQAIASSRDPAEFFLLNQIVVASREVKIHSELQDDHPAKVLLPALRDLLEKLQLKI